MTEQTRWVVTLSSERPLADVMPALAAAGFDVEQSLEAIGVVTGRCSAAAADRIRKIAGVADVAPDRDVGIGPPDGGGDYW